MKEKLNKLLQAIDKNPEFFNEMFKNESRQTKHFFKKYVIKEHNLTISHKRLNALMDHYNI